MKTISVIIPVYNVENKIVKCLNALKWADEVVVVDMFSADRTQEICATYPNVSFYQNQAYIFANVNYGIDQARGDWLMRLDSDEIVTPELAREIQEVVLSKLEDENSGYWVPSRTYFFGKWLKYGMSYDPRTVGRGYAMRKILFKKGTARYECKREHEDMTVTGTYGVLEYPYDHYSHDSISTWISKMNYYTDRDTERIETDVPSRLTAFYGLKMVVMPMMDFLKLYIRYRGYKDGMHGLASCVLNSLYTFVDRAKAWEKTWKARNPDAYSG